MRKKTGTQIIQPDNKSISGDLIGDIRKLIETARRSVAVTVNAEMCRIEHWSVQALRKKIDGMLYERTAISKKPEKLIEKDLAALREEDRLTPDLVFRDPYFLDFLGLKDTFSEKDIETAILREMESFILELGAGFSFVAHQKRIAIDRDLTGLVKLKLLPGLDV